MVLNVFLLVVGVAVVLWGADRFTDSASAVARRWKVSEMVIGLTVVAFGTSLPEFIVSFFSSLRGSADMSVGNIVGSNIFNTVLIVGASAVMMPLVVTRGVLHRDIPMSVGAALILFMLCHDGLLDRYGAVVLLVCFGFFMGYTYYIAVHGRGGQLDGDCQGVANESDSGAGVKGWFVVIGGLALGVACLVAGGQLLVDSASAIALDMGLSERLVGLTILAAGTSLPELATSVVAARKGSEGLALGNALGSNLFNVFFVLGVCSMVSPMHIGGISELDWWMMIGSGVLLFVVALPRRIGWIGGALLVAAYVAYMVAVVARS